MSKKRNTNRNRNKRVRRERGHWLDAAQATEPTERTFLGTSHAMPVHPGLTAIECPDCGATWSAPAPARRRRGRERAASAGGALDHAPTCPIGKGYAEASDDDRAWFIAHPNATERVRPPTMAEVQAVMLSTGQALPDMPNGGQLAPGGHVIVTKISNELRRRDFSHTMLLVAPALSPADGYHPDEFDETGKLWFREHIGPSDPESQS